MVKMLGSANSVGFLKYFVRLRMRNAVNHEYLMMKIECLVAMVEYGCIVFFVVAFCVIHLRFIQYSAS